MSASAETPPEIKAALGLERECAALPSTDLGNAERLVARHGRDLLYAPGIGWHYWDDRRWATDRTGEVERRMVSTVRAIYREAGGLEDDERRGKLGKWAHASESEARLRAAVSLARHKVEVVVESERLDADPWLLNVANGTLDLRTGELRDHRREDRLTKLAPVTFEPDAEGAEWDAFLEHLTGGDPELGAFLQRAAGYTLTGDTSEERLFFCHGPAATGKTTYTEALKGMLGDYGSMTDFETFLARRGDAGVRNDIARLVGSRLVLGVEVEEGRKLAEGLIKQLTGGDTIAARHLYRDFFEFTPQFKLWLAANHRPRVSSEDDAIWRRILQVPFTEVVAPADRDPELKKRLNSDAGRSAILAWAVEGCLAWQRNGLGVPERVSAYTEEYRQENDPLAEWLEDRCVREPSAFATSAELYKSYEEWAQDTGVRHPITSTALGKALASRGFEKARDRSRRGWRGLVPGTSGDGSDGFEATFGKPPREPLRTQQKQKTRHNPSPVTADGGVW
ncbi:MAG: phage/plasmid primase, P4 family [Actinomycetota bacterium]|nr:phage/plasmid primase, P4 family [Actinomycetota bacterium]